jgi:hypothetical protein
MRGLILLIIFLGNIVATPFVNSIHPVIFGMSFFLFWFLIWMIITPILTWWIYSMDRKRSLSSSSK